MKDLNAFKVRSWSDIPTCAAHGMQDMAAGRTWLQAVFEVGWEWEEGKLPVTGEMDIELAH